MTTKICPACNRELEATKEVFTLDKRIPGGLAARCRECERQRLNEYHRLHPEPSRLWRERNSEQIKAKKHLDYLKNIEAHKAKSKADYEKNKEKYHKISNQWRKDNPEKMRIISHRRYEKVKDRHRELTKRWKSEHRTERNIQWQARRAKKLSLPRTLTIEQWHETMGYFDGKCCYCGKAHTMTQDHFIPLSLDGGYTVDNILPCCLSCNSSKTNKTFEEWYPTYKYYSEKRKKKIVAFIELMQTASQV
jgi:5-methylcytosine-specific restriction endonuclease McrA